MFELGCAGPGKNWGWFAKVGPGGLAVGKIEAGNMEMKGKG